MPSIDPSTKVAPVCLCRVGLCPARQCGISKNIVGIFWSAVFGGAYDWTSMFTLGGLVWDRYQILD